MKKLLVITLVYAMMLSVSVLAAEVEEVSFLGLRLGEATIDEAIAALVNAGHLRTEIEMENDAYLFSSFEYRFDDEDKRFALGGCDLGGVTVKSQTLVSIAGHTTYSTSLDFIYSLENGLIIKDYPKLLQGSYTFYPEETKQVFDDLASKLDIKYGPSKSYRDQIKFNDEEYLWIEEMKVWEQPGGTAIVLKTRWYTRDGTTPVNTDYFSGVDLVYTRFDVREKLDTLSAYYENLALEAEQQRIEENKDNTDGL